MQKTTVRTTTNATTTWYIIDATGQVLGRLATRVATVLRGKHKPDFTPHVISGDCVIITNAAKVKLTGTKLDTKLYRKHSGYMGHLTERTARRQMEIDPTFVVRSAIEGMLRRNRLRTMIMRRLKVFSGSEHPYAAQKPQKLTM